MPTPTSIVPPRARCSRFHTALAVLGAATTAAIAAAAQDAAPGAEPADDAAVVADESQPLSGLADDADPDADTDIETKHVRITLGGIAAGVYQFQFGDEDVDGGALTVRPSLDVVIEDRHHVHVTFGFAESNALNDRTSLGLAPWAADLQDDLRGVAGTGRDYLQTAWYRHTFIDEDDRSLAVTAGIIDSTEYLEQAEHANDEFTQFMNETFVNAPVGFLPSYDVGAAIEWTDGAWGANGAVMRVEGDTGSSAVFVGGQIAWETTNELGDLILRGTAMWASDEFLETDGVTLASRLSLVATVDQHLGDHTAVWARAGWQDDDAAVANEWMLSGGVEFDGGWWGRERDTVGLGLAWLDGGTGGVDSTVVAEAYVRVGITERLAATLDVQGLIEDRTTAADLDALIVGGRLTLEF